MERDVVLLTTDFKPLSGGIAEYLHCLWNEVAETRPVTVLSAVAPGGETWEHVYDLVALPLPPARAGARRGDRFAPVRKLNKARYLFALHRSARRTVDAIRARSRGAPEVFIGAWNLGSHAWCRELCRAGIEYTLFAYGTEIVKPLAGRFLRWRSEDFAGARRVLAVSSGTAALVRERFGPDLDVGVVLPGVTPAPEAAGRPTPRARGVGRGIEAGSRTMLTVGRLVRRKGVDLVLQSLAELAAEMPDLRYRVAGDGPERGRLESLAVALGVENRVRFLGRVDEATKWALYHECDLFVMPNRRLSEVEWEGFGIVFLEAALAGTPVIGGDNGGVRDAVADGTTGLLVDPESPGALTGALRTLLLDAELRRRMGEAGRRRAGELFSWRTVAEHFRAELGWLVP